MPTTLRLHRLRRHCHLTLRGGVCVACRVDCARKRWGEYFNMLTGSRRLSTYQGQLLALAPKANGQRRSIYIIVLLPLIVVHKRKIINPLPGTPGNLLAE